MRYGGQVNCSVTRYDVSLRLQLSPLSDCGWARRSVKMSAARSRGFAVKPFRRCRTCQGGRGRRRMPRSATRIEYCVPVSPSPRESLGIFIFRPCDPGHSTQRRSVLLTKLHPDRVGGGFSVLWCGSRFRETRHDKEEVEPARTAGRSCRRRAGQGGGRRRATD